MICFHWIQFRRCKREAQVSEIHFIDIFPKLLSKLLPSWSPFCLPSYGLDCFISRFFSTGNEDSVILSVISFWMSCSLDRIWHWGRASDSDVHIVSPIHLALFPAVLAPSCVFSVPLREELLLVPVACSLVAGSWLVLPSYPPWIACLEPSAYGV